MLKRACNLTRKVANNATGRVMALPKLYNIALNYTIYCGLKSTISNLFSKAPVNAFYSLRRYCSKGMKVLNVAEKPDAAKNIAAHLSRGASRKVNN